MKLKDALYSSIVALFAAVILLMACSGDEEPPVVFPPTDQLTVFYISPSQAPVIDGQLGQSEIWTAAEGSQLISDTSSLYNPAKKRLLVDMIAVCDSTNLYILASWKDNTRNLRYHQWVWDSVSANDPNVPNPWRQKFAEKEDNISIFFTDDTTWSEGGESLAGLGPACSQMCHFPPDFLMVNQSGIPVDGWYWRSSLLNPLRRALDMYFEDSLDTDLLFNGLDAEDTPGYERNLVTAATNEIPKYWHKIDTLIEDIVINPETQLPDTNFKFIVANEDYLLFDSAVVFSSEEFGRIANEEKLDSVFVPAFVIYEAPTGSRWEVEARGIYDPVSSRWTVEFKRALNTGHADDLVFEFGKEYGMVVAIGNNAKHPHNGHKPILLKF